MDSRLIDVARQWVVDHYPFGSRHLTQTLVWLDRLAPGSPEAVRMAALTHDMERAFPGADGPLPGSLVDPDYYQAHSERSARIIGAWLREQTAGEPDEVFVADVEKLVRAHEIGGWPEANLVQAADSVSFLETNIDLFLGFGRSGKYPLRDIAGKFQWMYDRIQVGAARPLAAPLLASALSRLTALDAEMAATAAEPAR
jgi:hypothetical protein